MGRPKGGKNSQYNYWTIQQEREFKLDFFNMKTTELMAKYQKSRSSIKSKATEYRLRKSVLNNTLQTLDNANVHSAGIYCIINLTNGRKYVGSSCDIGQRIEQHLSNLRLGCHKNKDLQKDWKEEKFRWWALELTNKYEENEQLYLKAPNLYNKTPHIKSIKLSKCQIKHFWERVNKTDECWEWTGQIDEDGYGKLNGIRAHRMSYHIHNKNFELGLQVLHQCDNKKCVNPNHLSLGTNQENAIDNRNKGRHNKYQITWELVNKIREIWRNSNIKLKDLRKRFGFDVGGIVSNDSWYDPNYRRPIKKTRTGETIGYHRTQTMPQLGLFSINN